MTLASVLKRLRRKLAGSYVSELEAGMGDLHGQLIELSNRMNLTTLERDILRAQLEETRQERDRLWTAANRDIHNLTEPPGHLQIRVVGTHLSNFLHSGNQVASEIKASLEKSGLNWQQFRTVLDFGCGVGRVIRFFQKDLPQAELVGCDIDPEAIAWCGEHLGDTGRFELNPAHPPSPFPAGYFDFIFAVSILTHLPEDLQRSWLAELARITRPGGYLLLSVNGSWYHPHMPSEAKHRLDSHGFSYWDTGNVDGLPGFYQTAVHSEEYIRREWTRYFDILDFQPLAISRKQDAVICRRKPE